MHRGRLKNGNPSGDPSTAARCGARTRHGRGCKAPAMQNGRCRMHGGASTGPTTREGLERLRRARTRHGHYASEVIEVRRQITALVRSARRTLEEV